MDQSRKSDVVLITGGSGFLGQHIVRELQTKDAQNLKEIRILDLQPYTNTLKHAAPIPVVSFMADVCDKEAAREAFKGATCVMHLAAFIDYSFPANQDELERVNVEGTKVVISLCKEENVPVLLHCSTAEVALRPRLGPFPMVVGLTEHRATTPHKPEVLGAYVASKLKAEKIALAENKTYLSDGKGRLLVVALRPTFLFGELEPRILASALKAASYSGGALVDFQGPFGPGCRLQFTYAGNAAWAFVQAKEAMKQEPALNPTLSASGLPVFVTDHTLVHHPFQLLALLVSDGSVHETSLWLPLWLTYPVACAIENVSRLLGLRLPVQPSNFAAIMGGIAYFHALRAALCLNYAPVYDEEEAVLKTKLYLEANKMPAAINA